MQTTTQAPAGTKTKEQVRSIWSRARERKMSDEQLHDLVEAETGQRSIRALSREQADKVIVALGGVPLTKKVAKRTRQHHHQQRGVKQIVTEEQLKLMDDLARGRNWSDETLTKFCRRMIKRERPATTVQANKIIEALKAMNARDEQPPNN
ncbi:MAG: phage protein GemA/Gp16 family protein [Blastocatellales bacterium]